MATHSSTLAWKIPWMEDPVELQSMGSQRIGHDLMTEQQQNHEGTTEVPGTTSSEPLLPF